MKLVSEEFSKNFNRFLLSFLHLRSSKLLKLKIKSKKNISGKKKSASDKKKRLVACVKKRQVLSSFKKTF